MKTKLTYAFLITFLIAVASCSKKKKTGNGVKQGVNSLDQFVEYDVIDVSVPPSELFDLEDWSLSVPEDLDHNGKADHIKEQQLSSGYTGEYFYISQDSGMVFKCPIKGFKTSKNTSYTRTELREMLRAGDTKIKTKGPNGNNWVFQSSPDIASAAGYDGRLTATLAVNHVTTTGHPKQVGRVVIGQIHARSDEPLRLYYRKLPDNHGGSIYFAHEGNNNDQEDWYELIGSKASNAEEPEGGIALNEKFSYEVLVLGDLLKVTIWRSNKPRVEKTVDMSESGYDVAGEYMYFKAGVYNQNKTGDPDDYVQATFYALKNEHRQYEEEETENTATEEPTKKN